MLQAGRRGGGLERWMSACWFWRATKIMGARPHKMGARPHSERAPKIMGARPHKMGAGPHSERAPKIMGARPHPVGGLVVSSFSSCS
jgi:hypothetical protein